MDIIKMMSELSTDYLILTVYTVCTQQTPVFMAILQVNLC